MGVQKKLIKLNILKAHRRLLCNSYTGTREAFNRIIVVHHFGEELTLLKRY